MSIKFITNYYKTWSNLSIATHTKWLKTRSWNKQNNLEQHFVDNMKIDYKHKTNEKYENFEKIYNVTLTLEY
jgi:hypothetical protein